MYSAQGACRMVLPCPRVLFLHWIQQFTLHAWCLQDGTAMSVTAVLALDETVHAWCLQEDAAMSVSVIVALNGPTNASCLMPAGCCCHVCECYRFTGCNH